MNFIKKYFSLWLNENKNDFVNRIKGFKTLFLNNHFIINIILIIFTFFLNQYIFIILFIIFLIDIFIGRYSYLIKDTKLDNTIYSYLKSELIESIEDSTKKDLVDETDKLTEDYVNKEIKDNITDNIILVFLKKYFLFHEKLAKFIISFLLTKILKIFIPNTNFNNYLLKLIYIPYSIIKKILEFIISFILAILKFIFKKILYIIILGIIIAVSFFLPPLGIIIGILYILYLIYINIKKLILFFKYIYFKIKLFIKLIIKYFFIVLLAIIFYYAYKYAHKNDLDYIIYGEILIILFSIFLILLNIFNNFIGLSLFKSTPHYLIAGGISYFYPKLSTFYIAILSSCENIEASKNIIEIIKGNYNENFYNNPYSFKKVQIENVWKFRLYDFSFNKKKKTELEEKIDVINEKIDKNNLYKNSITKNINRINSINENKIDNINDNINKEKNTNTKNVNIKLTLKEKLELEELRKKALFEEEKRKIELDKQEKELELLKKKKEVERLKKKEKFKKQIKETNKKLKKYYKKGIKIIKLYLPKILSKGKKLKEEMSKNTKIKNLGLNNINKIKILKIDKKNKNYLILFIVSVFIILIGIYIYNNFYYNNQIIKIGNNINFKKDVQNIEYFNNNKIKIIPDNINNNSILSQHLMGYRKYDGFNYKKAGYSVIYTNNSNFPKNVENNTYNIKGKDIIVNTEKKNKNTYIIKYNEKLNRINLYNTQLFKKLNNFTNINTFYSNISNKINFISNSTLVGLIYKNIEIGNIIDKIDTFVNTDKLKSKLIGLDIKNNKLILRIKYDFYNKSKENFNFLFESIDQLDNDIPEESILTYEKSQIKNKGDHVNIEIEFTIDKDKINKNTFTKIY